MVSNEPELCKEKCGDLYAQLLNARETAKSLRDQLALTNLERPCPGCGRMVKGPIQFCTHCGNKMPEINMDSSVDFSLPNKQQVIQNPSGETCQSCGSPLKEGAVFCVNCGAAVPGAQAPAAADSFNQEPAAAPVVGTCRNCGAELQADDAFCTSCGTPV
jgi:predicted amidophosphoribosyltransferase